MSGKRAALFGAGIATGLAAGAVGSAIATLFLQGRRTISRHVDDYREHWADRRGAGDGVIHYVALGDSAAQGVGATTVARGYVPQLADRLRAATGQEVAVTNLSVSGATSDDVVRDQLPQLAALDFTPDLVTLDIGGNDVVFPGHNHATFSASLRTILAALPSGSFVADPPWFTVPVLGRQSRRMAATAATLVVEYGHNLVPLHRVTREPGRIGYHRYTAHDFFHPNDAGYAGWAEAFWEVIEASGIVEALTANP